MPSVDEKAPDGPELAPAPQVEGEGDQGGGECRPARDAVERQRAADGCGRLAVRMRGGVLGDGQLEPVVQVVGARPLDDETAVPASDETEHGGGATNSPGPARSS